MKCFMERLENVLMFCRIGLDVFENRQDLLERSPRSFIERFYWSENNLN